MAKREETEDVGMVTDKNGDRLEVVVAQRGCEALAAFKEEVELLTCIAEVIKEV